MRALEKDFLREVQHSKSRFLSIFILAALAVAFLSGLRATAPDMKQTIDSYMDDAHFMDVQVLSTLGLTEDDVDSIAGFPRAVEGVEIGVMIRETPDGREKISMRTGEDYNASALCARLGGGGHRAAAGATVDLGFAGAKATVLAALRAEGVEV